MVVDKRQKENCHVMVHKPIAASKQRDKYKQKF